MKKKNKPLPKPPTTPFGRRKRLENDAQDPLLADEMAMAMAQGNLDEFMDREMPDNEYARKLADMMMGMTGMMAQNKPLRKREENSIPDPVSSSDETIKKTSSHAQTPEEIIKAAQSGDVGRLVELLHKEHLKRFPDTDDLPQKKPKTLPNGQPKVEKVIIEQLMEIADKNNVTPEWLVLRALTLYVRDYLSTGRL